MSMRAACRHIRPMLEPSLRAPTLLIFGDRDFSPLPDVVELFGLLPNAQLAVLPGTTHVGVARHSELLALMTPFLDAR